MDASSTSKQPRHGAWDRIGQALTERGSEAPLSAYVHIPFCDRKCAFYDCYALFLDPSRRSRKGVYIDTLLREVEAWATLPNLGKRPVTTIHFGGGTPNY